MWQGGAIPCLTLLQFLDAILLFELLEGYARLLILLLGVGIEAALLRVCFYTDSTGNVCCGSMPILMSETDTALTIRSVRSFNLFVLDHGWLIRYQRVLLLRVTNLARLIQLVDRWLSSTGDWTREGIRVISTRLVLHRVHQGSIASWWITISNTTDICSHAANPPVGYRWTLHNTWTRCCLLLCVEMINILLKSAMISECCRRGHANFTTLVICCQQSRFSEMTSRTYIITTFFVYWGRSISV